MIVVIGSTGHTGSVVADELLKKGLEVRLVSRSKEKVAHFAARGADVVSADLHDTVTLAAAFTGARGIYLMIPSSEHTADMLGENRAITASLVEAVRMSQPAHVVLLSSIGAHLEAGTGPIRALHHAERALSAVASHITCLRAGYFMDNFAADLDSIRQGALPTFLEPDREIPMVASRDIGALAADRLQQATHGRSVIELEGPRAYSVRDVASELSRLLRRDIALQPLPVGEMAKTLEGFGFPRASAALYQEMTHGLNSGHIVREEDAAVHVRGPTTLSVYLEELVACTRWPSLTSEALTSSLPAGAAADPDLDRQVPDNLGTNMCES